MESELVAVPPKSVLRSVSLCSLSICFEWLIEGRGRVLAAVVRPILGTRPPLLSNPLELLGFSFEFTAAWFTAPKSVADLYALSPKYCWAGSNGKSLVLESVAAVSGDVASSPPCFKSLALIGCRRFEPD